MGETRAALYLDFDNFFSGLLATDPQSAFEVATSPTRWLSRLTYSHGADGGRRWLALRCYLNPRGSVVDPRDGGERIYLSKFRPHFTQAGFEVVDCPPLARGKNAADIRIVIDALGALNGPARIDEFVLASSDSDFTPLFHVIRAHDRRITMIGTGEIVAAYEAVADRVLGAQEMVDLVRDSENCLEDEAGEPEISEGGTALQDAFRAEMVALYREASEPINLAKAATHIAKQLGQGVRASNWLGAGSFGRAVRALNLPNVAFSQHYLWDTSRHVPPDQKMPEEVVTLCDVTRLPRIPREDWPRVYNYLESYGQENEFNLTEASRWPRDKAAEDGHAIARTVFAYVLAACARNGVRFDARPRPTAEMIAGALLASVVAHAESVGIELDAAGRASLTEWLGVRAQ